MAYGFTTEERQRIRLALRRQACACAVSPGMRKTTVEALTQAAGISKGAFYLFYPSKELLFLEVLEELHTLVYGRMAEQIREHPELPAQRRLSQAVLSACDALESSGMLPFWENDVPALIQKIPEDILARQYHADSVHIRDALRPVLADEERLDLAAAAVQSLMLTLTHRRQIGPLYSQVLRITAEGLFRELCPAASSAQGEMCHD